MNKNREERTVLLKGRHKSAGPNPQWKSAPAPLRHAPILCQPLVGSYVFAANSSRTLQWFAALFLSPSHLSYICGTVGRGQSTGVVNRLLYTVLPLELKKIRHYH